LEGIGEILNPGDFWQSEVAYFRGFFAIAGDFFQFFH
jgi:hypothetical protein